MQGIRVIVAMLATLLALGAGIALAQDDSSSTVDPALSAPPQPDPGVELVDKRTAASQTFRLPDGQLQTRIFESPIHYRDIDGDWKPIGDRLEEVEGGGFSNGPNRFDVDLPARLGTDPVRLSVGGEWVSSELVGPASEEAQLEGDTASYESADAGTSFELTGLANGIKEDIVIADASQPSTFRFELSASDGLIPTLVDDGSIEFRDAEDHVVVALPAPVISDSAPGASPVSDAVHYALEPQGQGGWQLAVEADPEWLAQPERIWPARIDPTLTIPNPSLDCAIGGKQGEAGWGGCGSTGRKEALLTFPWVK